MYSRGCTNLGLSAFITWNMYFKCSFIVELSPETTKSIITPSCKINIFLRKLNVWFYWFDEKFVVLHAFTKLRIIVESCYAIKPWKFNWNKNGRYDFISANYYHKVMTRNWISQVPWWHYMSPHAIKNLQLRIL